MHDKRQDSRLRVRLEPELQTESEFASLYSRNLNNKSIFIESEQQKLPAEGFSFYIDLKQNLRCEPTAMALP